MNELRPSGGTACEIPHADGPVVAPTCKQPGPAVADACDVPHMPLEDRRTLDAVAQALALVRPYPHLTRPAACDDVRQVAIAHADDGGDLARVRADAAPATRRRHALGEAYPRREVIDSYLAILPADEQPPARVIKTDSTRFLAGATALISRAGGRLLELEPKA